MFTNTCEKASTKTKTETKKEKRENEGGSLS